MRILAKILIIASVAAGVATLGPAGAAHASTVQCDEKTMIDRGFPDLLVVTCAEADGDLRRTQSIVVNNSDHAIELRVLWSLLSYPEYAEANCPTPQLAPGAQAVCLTRWVVKRPYPFHGNHIASFTRVHAVDAQGRAGIQIFNIHTTL